MIGKDPRNGDKRNIIAHARRDSRDLACSEHESTTRQNERIHVGRYRQCVIAARRSESDVPCVNAAKSRKLSEIARSQADWHRTENM